MSATTEVLTISAASALFTAAGPLYGFDPDAIDETDYDTARAAALYRALGASPADEEYVLGVLPDGRWALVGMTVAGHRFALERRDRAHSKRARTEQARS